MIKNENFIIRNPYSFGFKDILFPEESKLQVEDKERLINAAEAKKKVASISGKELTDLFKTHYISNFAELISALITEIGLDEYFSFVQTGKIGALGYPTLEDNTVSSINTLVKANLEASCRIKLNKEEERELVYEVRVNLLYGPGSSTMLEKIKSEQKLTTEVISFIEKICLIYNTYMSSGEKIKSLYFKQLKEVLYEFTRVLDQDSEYMKPKISVASMYREKERFLALGLGYLMRSTLDDNPEKTNFYVDFAKIVKQNTFFSESLKMGVSYSIRDWAGESFYGRIGEEKEGVFFTNRSCDREIYLCLEKPGPYNNFLCTREEEILEEENVFLAKPIRHNVPSPTYFHFDRSLEAIANKIWK